MTITSYIKKLQKLADKHPKAQVVYSMDDGTHYKRTGIMKLAGDPSAGVYQNESIFSDVDEWIPSRDLKVNAILLN